MAKLNSKYEFAELEEIVKELKEDNEGNWMEVSAFEESIDALKDGINRVTGGIAENYILKLLPELSELYGRIYVYNGEIIWAVMQYSDQKITQDIAKNALKRLVDTKKITQIEINADEPFGPAYIINKEKMPEKNKK